MAALTTLNTLLNTFDSDEKSSKNEDNIANSDLLCDILYAKNVGRHFRIEMASDKTAGKYDMDLVSMTVPTTVKNGRNIGITYGATGFQLCKQETKLSTKDFYCNDDNIIQKVYYKEIEDKVKELIGCEYARCLHHAVRCRKPPKYAKQVDVPAHAAHTDYSAGGAYKTYKTFRPKDDKYKKGRYTVLNVWRNISDTNPIQQDHLALVDARSVNGPDDFLPYDYIANGYKSESYYANAVGAQIGKYKWYYFPKMSKNEILIFKQFDSDYTSQSRYTFHSAIHDNTAAADAPPRESIEARLVCYFPSHEPNTIPPDDVKKTKEQQIESSVISLFKAITEQVHYWPKTMYNGMAVSIRNKDVAAVIKNMVEKSAEGGYHGLADATKEQINQVVEAMMKRKDEFEQTVLKNFVIEENDEKETESTVDVVKNGVEGIFNAFGAVEFWPETSKQKMVEFVNNNKDNIQGIIEYSVKGSADGGHHGLGKANENQIKEVVNAIYERKDEFNDLVMKNFKS